MFSFNKFGFSRYEGILSMGIVAIGLLVFLPSIKQKITYIMHTESRTSAQVGVETFAQSIYQFHDETGQWPAFKESNPAPAMVMGTLARETAASTTDDTGLFDEKPMPLDPWDNPFLVHVLDPTEDDVQIMVLSTGPNGSLETELSDAWYKSISQRLINPGNEDTHLQGDIFGGDDVGFVLSKLSLKGNQ